MKQHLKTSLDWFFNPRRDDWDTELTQEAINETFAEQVNWELDHIAIASHVLLYFAPGTQSPISLLELGILANKRDAHRVTVICPPTFWRKGNVDIVCSRVGIPVYTSLEIGLDELRVN